MGGVSKHWRFTHNFMHHKYTNILGMDDDVGYGMLRVTRDQRWKPFNVGNLCSTPSLRLGSSGESAFQHLELGKVTSRVASTARRSRRGCASCSGKVGRQVIKDYVAFPALTSLSPGATYSPR